MPRRQGKSRLQVKRTGPGTRSLSAAIAGVSETDEARCDELNRAGEELRASVGWRIAEGKGEVLAAVTGVPLSALVKFYETGEIDFMHKAMLEMNK